VVSWLVCRGSWLVESVKWIGKSQLPLLAKCLLLWWICSLGWGLPGRHLHLCGEKHVVDLCVCVCDTVLSREPRPSTHLLLPSVAACRSHSPQVRATCASTLLQFLLDYPLGPKRLAAHLSFLATNLGFEHETGRLAVLDMLQQVGRFSLWSVALKREG
jgi:hypothetical protein